MTPEDVQASLKRSLDAALQQFLEDPITPKTREEIQTVIIDVLSDYEDRGLIDRAGMRPRLLIDHNTRTVHIQWKENNG